MLFHDILFLILGLVLILLGGNYVTDGGVIISKRLRISPLVVGLTILAFGSSTPDLAVSVMATVQGHTAMAVGDVVGADIFDMLLAVGITLLIAPVVLTRQTWRIDIPMLVVSAAVLFVCANTNFILGRGDTSAHDTINRVNGIILLLIYIGFLWLTLRHAHGCQPDKGAPAGAAVSNGRVWAAVGMILGGLVALVIGGNWIVSGGSGIAQKCGMSEGMVGLTIVGIGSSLPDLSSSAMAALKKQTGMAIGNLIGSCVFDILVVVGVSATIRPLEVEGVKFANFCVLLGAALLILALSRNKERRLGRVTGAVLTALYIAYMTWMVTTI